MSALRIESAAATDRGTVREINEDSVVALLDRGIWLVADGMGGHAQGDWASQAIVAAVSPVVADGDLETAVAACADAIHAANAAIFARGEAAGARMGSTVVALVVRDRGFAVIWAGDSRAYLVRHGAVIQLSRDHSVVQGMLDRGLIDEAAARDHPMGHVLARAVGVEAVLELDVIADTVVTGDVFLLCSDGLHGVMTDAEILATLRAADPEDAPRALIDASIAAGTRDNVTVVVVRAFEPTLLVVAAAEPVLEP